MQRLGSRLDRLRKPAYTGENRCAPCTAVNLAIAAVVSVAVGAAWIPAGVAVFAVSAALVYLRGYLVPGTPELTKRYMPRWALALFGKAPPERPTAAPAEADPEGVLREAGVLVERDGDVALSDAFYAAWRDRARSLREGDLAAPLARLLGVDADDVRLGGADETVVALAGEEHVGTWVSRPALVADLAAAGALAAKHDGWADLDTQTRGYVLAGVRSLLDVCPVCEGTVAAADEVDESCCGQRDIYAVRCVDCDALLLEMPAEE